MAFQKLPRRFSGQLSGWPIGGPTVWRAGLPTGHLVGQLADSLSVCLAVWFLLHGKLFVSLNPGSRGYTFIGNPCIKLSFVGRRTEGKSFVWAKRTEGKSFGLAQATIFFFPSSFSPLLFPLVFFPLPSPPCAGGDCSASIVVPYACSSWIQTGKRKILVLVLVCKKLFLSVRTINRTLPYIYIYIYI